ncbi:MAG: hypothetical protein WBM00_05975 [Solirubrobacterales bacterium]
MKRAWWVIGAIAVVLGLFASVGPGLDAIEGAADSLGENPVALIALAMILVGIFSFAIGRRSSSWGMRPGHLEADKETFADLIEIVPRRVIDFLKEHDFGNSWSGNQTEPLYIYVAERNAVEHQFHNKAIERKRAQLQRDCEAFVHTLAGYAVPSGSGNFFEMNEKEWVRSHPPGDEADKRFEAHRRELGELADAVVAAYDDFVATARRRLPGA